MSRRVLTSSSLGLLWLALALSCGSTSRTNVGAMGAGHCETYCDRLAECDESVDTVGCRSACEAQVPGGGASLRPDSASVLTRCLKEQSCAALSSDTAFELCTDGGGGAGAGGGSGLACPAAVRCLDASTAQYCTASGASETAVCATEMMTQGIVSNGCSSDPQGDGCTVDAFMDPECEAGAPVFARCEGLAEEELLSAYVACFQNFNGALLVIPCYQDFVDASGTTVDCTAARVSCAVP